MPDLTELEAAAIAEVLATPRLSLGPRVVEFEQVIAKYVGCAYGVAVNSGTSALHLIVRSLGIGDGDEVVTTPFSFVASANCLLYERAVPKFVDIDPLTLNIDCALIEGALTPRTKAVLGVDVFGRPADWNRLREIADEHGLLLIEDSCEALGARCRLHDGNWAMAGSLADAGTFAFYPNKQITTGEGGMVVTDRENLARLCRSMRNQGRDQDADWLCHDRLGYNYRLSDINCALGIAQMERIDEILEGRRRVAGWYGELLSEVAGVDTPGETQGAEISWFVYVVRLSNCNSRADLAEAIRRMRSRGIECSNYFYPIHLQPFYRDRFGYGEGDFPVAERVSSQTMALPFSSRLRENDAGRVAASLEGVVSELGLG
jgi:perosamine synthetase